MNMCCFYDKHIENEPHARGLLELQDCEYSIFLAVQMRPYLWVLIVLPADVYPFDSKQLTGDKIMSQVLWSKSYGQARLEVCLQVADIFLSLGVCSPQSEQSRKWQAWDDFLPSWHMNRKWLC